MNELVVIKDNDVFTDSLVIAKGTENKHKNVKELIMDYKKEFLQLGTLAVLNRESTGGRPENYYLLNEHQAIKALNKVKKIMKGDLLYE